VNERQPVETVGFIVAESRRRGFVGRPVVAVMGMAFKGVPATDDLRGSMAIKVLEALEGTSADFDVRLFDPVIPAEDLKANFPGRKICESLDHAVANADIVVIANNHPALAQYTPARLVEVMNPSGFIYDYWNHFSNLSSVERGYSYFAVGNTGKRTA